MRWLWVGTLLLCGCEVVFDPAKRKPCEPKPCAAGACGRFADGCGHSVDCKCAAPQTCGGGGAANVCGCTPESDADLCTAKGAKCGSLTADDNCGKSRTVGSCGTCELPETCGGGGTAKVCGCASQSDADLCAASEAMCGALVAKDNCGQTRSVASCGSCADPNRCGGYGDDNVCGAIFAFPNWSLPPESPGDFTDNRDGTVSDNVTGLVWQQAVGAVGEPWMQAKQYCANLALAGRVWRLPSRIELASLVDYDRNASPLINPSAFPDAAADRFWAASPYAVDRSAGWYVDFSTGYTGPDTGAVETAGVRCVSGAPPAPAQRYHVVDANLVTDTATGLTWQRGISPAEQTYSGASSYCTQLSLEGATWRLPNVKELESIVDETTYDPAIDTAVFLNKPSGSELYFWSSTTDVLVT